MNLEQARRRADELEVTARRDRIFLNNPVVMQGLGLAPLVVAATSGINALRLCVAVALLLTPTRMLGGQISRAARLGLAARGFVYCLIASLLYVGVYPVMTMLFGVDVIQLGLYLPLLVVEPLIIKRYERPDQKERLRTALRKGLRTTIGYAIILLLLGCGRELLASGTVLGKVVMERALLPMASLPAGGFILLGILCALWRGAVSAYKHHVNTEARRGV